MTKPSGTGRPSPCIRMSPEPLPPHRAKASAEPRLSENPWTNLPILASTAPPPVRRSSSGAFMLSSYVRFLRASRKAPPPRQARKILQLGDDLLRLRDGGGAHAQFGDAELDEFRDHVGLAGRLAADADPDARRLRRLAGLPDEVQNRRMIRAL